MIARTFAARRAEGRAALVPYATAGYPRRDSTVGVLEALADAGADVLELGVPFSDPLADGPTIQKASFLSLQNGTTLPGVLEDLAAFRARRDTPVVLFTYLNPVMRYGLMRFLADAEAAGANGLLLTDLPTGSDPEIEAEVVASPLDLIRLIAPTTRPERVPEAAAGGSGFLYYISTTGVTGARDQLRSELADEVAAIRAAVDLPVVVGFGISTPEQAAAVASVADGIAVGSAVIQALERGDAAEAARFVGALRAAMDARARVG
ncbi:MAG TPA: tryptophan synthase subunit alpha [Longimicrobiales bacterium]|nr:tryptophan synthase subunit alpha [Longimicrobiales bacterium]